METQHTLELGAVNLILYTIDFSKRKIGGYIDCESCESHRNDAMIFTRKNEDKKERKKTIYIFIYIIFILNREISIFMVSPFFNTDVFRSFYP